MTDPREHLHDVLVSIINATDDGSENTNASEAIHNYMVAKSRELANRPPVSDSGDD